MIPVIVVFVVVGLDVWMIPVIIIIVDVVVVVVVGLDVWMIPVIIIIVDLLLLL